MRTLFDAARARFAMLGNSLFWASAAVLRLLLVAWAPVVLRDAKRERRRRPHVVPGARHRRRRVARAAAHPDRAPAARAARGLCDGRRASCCSASSSDAWPARAVLVAIGVCGGMFLVPINAALQDIGHRTIGSGRAVALQSFFENSAMLTGVGIYTASVGLGGAAGGSIVVVGVLVLIATTLVSWRLPPDPVQDGSPDAAAG